MTTIAERCAALLGANGGHVMSEHIREAATTNRHRGHELRAVKVSRDHGWAHLVFDEDGSVLEINSYREEVKAS